MSLPGKWLLGIVVVGLLAGPGLFIFSVLIDRALGFDKFYSKQDLIDNYNRKSGELAEVRRYSRAITPASAGLRGRAEAGVKPTWLRQHRLRLAQPLLRRPDVPENAHLKMVADACVHHLA